MKVEPTPVEQPKTFKELVEEYLGKYNKLCQEYQMQIVVTPAFKYMKDTDMFGVVQQISVGKLPKVEEE